MIPIQSIIPHYTKINFISTFNSTQRQYNDFSSFVFHLRLKLGNSNSTFLSVFFVSRLHSSKGETFSFVRVLFHAPAENDRVTPSLSTFQVIFDRVFLFENTLPGHWKWFTAIYLSRIGLYFLFIYYHFIGTEAVASSATYCLLENLFFTRKY